MIVKLTGKIAERKEHSLVIEVGGISYEVFIPVSVLGRVDEQVGEDGNISLVIYHYFQIGPSSGLPLLVGFLSEIEKDFFLSFIKVSGIGPRAAVKALNKSISEISRAIEEGDYKFLKTLPGIGAQKAKEIIAKLQGKIGKYGLIQDQKDTGMRLKETPDWQEEALEVLLQLQYKKTEAVNMINKALERAQGINSAEELLNEIYKQRMKS